MNCVQEQLIMPCHITTRSAIKKTTRKTTTKKAKNKNFTAKSQYLYLKATSKNVKLQSDRTLTTQIYFYFFVTTQQMDVILNET